ncbi:MAG: SMI1/KNR4 family protein [Burkholderiales bacterium]|jgi:hypothetical protein|nr:SMI1/KNR4 family protein [Burkholderiales bacterium]
MSAIVAALHVVRHARWRINQHFLKSYEGNKLDFPEDGWPRFPSNYLKIANSAGQDAILLELGGDHLGRVWYWPENADAWGRGTNTMLGFVAENFYDFINRLRPWVEA